MLVHFFRFIEKLKATPARKNKLIIIPLAIGLIFNILMWVLIYFKFRPLVANLPEDQAFIPLHYNIYLGVDLFGKWQKIFMLPGLGLFFLFLNTVLALVIYNKRALISYFLSSITPIIQIFFLVATIITILINI